MKRTLSLILLVLISLGIHLPPVKAQTITSDFWGMEDSAWATAWPPFPISVYKISPGSSGWRSLENGCNGGTNQAQLALRF